MASGLEIESATVLVTDLATAPVIDRATALANAQATGLEQRLLVRCAHCQPRALASLPNRSSRLPHRRVRVATTAENVRTNAQATTGPHRP